MKNLIILTPKTIQEQKFLEIMEQINKHKIIGLKLKKIDFFGIEQKIKTIKNKTELKKIKTLLNTPSVLVVINGTNIIEFGKQLEKKYGKEYIHSSKTEQIAKYEIERFFNQEEIIEY